MNDFLFLLKQEVLWPATLTPPLVAMLLSITALIEKEARKQDWSERLRWSRKRANAPQLSMHDATLEGAPGRDSLIGQIITVVFLRQPEDRAKRLSDITKVLAFISLLFSMLLAATPRDHWFTGHFLIISIHLDGLSIYFLLLINLVAFFASCYTFDFVRFKEEDANKTEARTYSPEVFHVLFNGFHLTMLLVPLADNLVVLWVAIELTTLASTLLVGFELGRRRAVEAAWKYIMITTAGIVLALFGTILFADAIPPDLAESDSDPLRWSVLTDSNVVGRLNAPLVMLGFLLILVGYGTKAGFAPMHTWLPDGHGEAPSPVSALLSGVLLKCALYAILRFYTITNMSLQASNPGFATYALLLTGLFALVSATPFILKKNRFKRVLAYHSLEHMGIIAFGIGIGGSLAIFGALLHALNHALVKCLMFLSFENVRQAFRSHNPAADLDENRIHDLMHSMPLTSSLLLLGGVGLVGSPPLSIFFSETIIIWAAVESIVQAPTNIVRISTPLLFVGIVLFLVTVTLIFGGLVRHLASLLLYQERVAKQSQVTYPGSASSASPDWRHFDNWRRLWLLFVLLGITVLFGFCLPSVGIDFPRLISESACIVQYGAQEVLCLHH